METTTVLWIILAVFLVVACSFYWLIKDGFTAISEELYSMRSQLSDIQSYAKSRRD